MATLTLEEHVAAETRLQQIEHRQEPDKSEESLPWWKPLVGIYQDSPDFEEVVRLGREWRAADDTTDESATHYGWSA